MVCYKCQKPGHVKSQCKTPKSQLKCNCNTTGRHNSSDFCKERQIELAKANQVEGSDGSPVGTEDEEGKANLVDAEEETDSDEDQEGYVYTVDGEEDVTEELLECSARESLKPTPRVALR